MDIAVFRYMERLHLSYQQALETPWAEIERALFIWSLDGDRDKLEVERQKSK